MPIKENTNPNSSPFDIVTSSKSKKGKKGIFVAVIIVVFLLLSVVAGVLLVRQSQNIQEKADTAGSASCASGYTSTHLHECKSSCTNENNNGDPWYWINATTGGNCQNGPNNEPRRWCDLDECELLSTPVPSASPTLSPSPTVLPTASASGTPKSATSSSTLRTTPRPIPTTGVDWPTAAGVIVGIGAIVISILLAL